MKVARYVGDGKIVIANEPAPACPAGGLLVRTQASGLCSGELMSWYMDRKIPHVLGHEVVGTILESDDARFAVGDRVFPHHHAPCLSCEFCREGLYVHCAQWKRTKLDPGGMADVFAVGNENLSDTVKVNELRPRDGALVEPLACVMKSFRLSAHSGGQERTAVIGLGVMGLIHLIVVGEGAVGYDLNPARIDWARRQGLHAEHPEKAEPASCVYVCPGSQGAFDFAMQLARPGATIVMFAPLAPSQELRLPQDIYFRDIKLVHSYSCGPDDTAMAVQAIKGGRLKAEQVVSHFIGIDELPVAYEDMKAGRILKPMVLFE